MVSLAQALQQVEKAEESAQEREKEIRRSKAQFGALKQPATIATQLSLARRVGVGRVGQEITRRRKLIRKEKRRGSEAVRVAKEELKGFREEVGRTRGQIVRVQEQERRIAEFKAQQRLVEDLISGRAPPQVKGELTRVGRKILRITQAERRRALEKRTEQLKALKEKIPATRKLDIFDLLPPRSTGIRVKDLTFLGRAEEKREVLRKFPLIGFQAGVALGIGKTGIGAFQFGKRLVTKPIPTAKGTIVGLGEIIKSPRSFIEKGVKFAREKPAEAIGRGIGEFLLFKGSGKVISIGSRGVGLGRTVVSPKFRPVTSRELTQFGTTEKFIGGIPQLGGKGEIALIPGGLERRVGTLRPSVRGGFGFTQAEQKALLKQRGPLVTAQADFLSATFGKPLKKGLFATPPFQDTGFVRVSRLGLTAQKEATLSDIISGDFTFRRGKPSIIAFPLRGGFDLRTTIGSELEVVAPAGRILKKTGQPAVSIIEKRRVPIITAEFVETSKETSKLFGRARAGEKLTLKEARRLRKATGFDISRTLETRPFVSPSKLTGSLGVSTSKQLSSFLGISPGSLGVSVSPRPRRKGKITPRARPSPRPSGFISSSKPSPPGRIERGLRGFSASLPGLGFPRITQGFGFTTSRRKGTVRRVKLKKPKVRQKPRFSVAPSFTAVSLGITGKFPTPKIKGLGLLPSQLRVIPRRRTRRRK